MPKITLSVSSMAIKTKAAGEKVTSGFELQTFDLRKPTKLKRVLSSRLHSTNVWQDGTISLHQGEKRVSLNIGVTGLMLDFDGSITLKELQERFADYIYVVYSSTGHTKERPKLHLLLPFDPQHLPVYPNDVDALYAWCKRQQGKDGLFHGADRCFDKGRKFYPHCAGEAAAKMVLHVNAEGHYFPLPDVTAFTVRATEEADIDPEQYNRQRTRYIRELWDRTDAKNRTQAAYQLALDCRRSGIPYDEAKERLLAWIEAQKKTARMPFGKDGVSAEERLEQQVLHGAYHNTPTYQPPPNPETPPEWPSPSPAPDDDHPIQRLIDEMPVIIQRTFFPTLTKYPPLTQKQARTGMGRAAMLDMLQRELNELHAHTLSELYADSKPEEAPDWLVPFFRFGMRKTVTMLAGKDKAGKGTIMSVAMKHRPAGQRVLFFNADEPTDDFRHRMRTVEVPPCDEIRHVKNPASWEAIVLHIHTFRPDLVVLDALISMLISLGDRPDGYSNSLEWMEIIQKTVLIAENYDLGVIWLHHTNQLGAALGGAAVVAGASNKIVVSKDKRPHTHAGVRYDGLMTLDPEGRRDMPTLYFGYTAPYQYTLLEGYHDRTASDRTSPEWPNSSAKKKAIKLVDTYGHAIRLFITGKPVTKKEIDALPYGRQKMNRFYEHGIETHDGGKTRQATLEQLEEWRSLGVDALLSQSGSVRSALHDKDESEE